MRGNLSNDRKPINGNFASYLNVTLTIKHLFCPAFVTALIALKHFQYKLQGLSWLRGQNKSAMTKRNMVKASVTCPGKSFHN